MFVVYYVFMYPCFLATKSLYGSCQPCAKIFRPNLKPQVHGFVAWNINVEESMRKATTEFSPDELLIFIGHSDDASAEVEAILSLKREIDRAFGEFLKVNSHRSPFRRWDFWEWREDALTIPGGQEVVVRDALDHARIAIFVFKDRVGTVTWQELEEVRERSRCERLHILSFFPEKMPDHGKFLTVQAQLQAYRDWTALLERQEKLTSDWTGADSCSVTPCPPYQGLAELKNSVLQKVRAAMADIFAIDSPGYRSEPLARVDASVALLQSYHATLKQQFGNMTLMGSPAFGHVPLQLSETFVSLSLSGSLRCEDRTTAEGCHCGDVAWEKSITPEKVMCEVFVEQRCPLLLIIGEPGSGKTTLLKHYALCCLDDRRYAEFGFSELVKVFFLPLRELQKDKNGYAELEHTLAAWSQKNVRSIDANYFSLWLGQPSALVLLDGLDEISTVDDRIAVCKWIDRTVGRFARAKFVVTSRSTGYRKGDGIELEAGHRRADILDFSSEQKALFLHRWFKAAFLAEICPDNMKRAEWQKQQKERAANNEAAILAFLAQENNNSLRLLAGVPLLLQIMAMLWKERGYLAKDRIELYDAALNFMLDYRDRRREIEPLLAAKDARRVLSPVSLWMQEVLQKDEVDRTEMEQQMQVQLDTFTLSLPASDFCRHLVDRAGLLLEYCKHHYVFRHKSFREYLAGVQLVKNIHKPGALDKLVSHFGDDWWTEVFRFFIGQVDDAELFDSFMQKLFDSPVTDVLTQKQQNLLVALVEEAPQRKSYALCTKLLDPLTTANRQRYLLECLKAIGKPEALAAMTEFRQSGMMKEERVVDVQFDKLGAEYILIKGGTFIYSLTEKPETVQEMYVAKYTVTNQHYRRFINYLAARDPEFAKRVPLKTYKKRLQELASSIKGFSDWLKEELSLAKRFCSFYDDDKRFNRDDQPVMGLSWYAARAYCLWLSLLEQNEGDTALYRLPTEMEWEYAAGGKESRTYPWGEEEPSPTRANYNNNEGATTSIGRYPEGVTPEGLHDMAGNVWEWTADWYDDDCPAIRGGVYYSRNADALRCSSRNNYLPWLNNDDVGFRVIRSSHSSSS